MYWTRYLQPYIYRSILVFMGFVFFKTIGGQGCIIGGKYVTENKGRVCLFRGIVLCLEALLATLPERVRVLHRGRFTECAGVRMRPHPGFIRL